MKFRANFAVGASIILQWIANPSPTPISTYKVYRGSQSHVYPFVQEVGNVTTATVGGVGDFVAVSTVDVQGFESALSTELQLSAAPTPIPVFGLSFDASAGVILPPFMVMGTTISQVIETVDPAHGGRALYNFNVPAGGNYLLSALVNCANDGSNSFFVNVDSEPTTTMVWSIDLTSGLEARVASWAVGTPKIWALTSGSHQLIFRGREGGAVLGRITFGLVAAAPTPSPTPTATAGPNLVMTMAPVSATVLAGGGAASYAITVQRTGFNSAVTLTAEVAGKPASVGVYFTSNPASSTSTLKLLVAPYTPPGTYQFTVTGSGSLALTRTVLGTLIKLP